MGKYARISYRTWKPLSMHEHTPINYNGYVFKNLYTLAYALAFPSRRDEIMKMGTTKLRDLRLGLEYFEVSEKQVIHELLKAIVQKCLNNVLFLDTLKATDYRIIINSDYYDDYFGYRQNIYGKCLMKVRDEKLYLDENYIN